MCNLHPFSYVLRCFRPLKRLSSLYMKGKCSTISSARACTLTEGLLRLFQVIYMTGWSPHERQQQAMPRGSATVSFEDLQAMIEKQKRTE